jgi:hypothetical protein
MPLPRTPSGLKASGGICVKTYFQRGFGRARNLPAGPEVLADVRKAASQAGLVLMMRANAFEAQQFGVEGSVDVLAHGMCNWEISTSNGIQAASEICTTMPSVPVIMYTLYKTE